MFIGAEQFLATKEHPNFGRICGELEAKNSNPGFIRELFDTGIAIERKFTRVSERVMIKQGNIFFDGMPMNTVLADAIIRFQYDGQEDFMPLVNFMEKIETNPSEHSREHLFRWLSKHKFALAPDGDFIAYKGVSSDGLSVNAGSAIVNGVLVDGKIPNAPGTIVEMPRDLVTFNPEQGCSVGLHAGNWRYASTFSQKTLRVKINPRDVVSVPTDSQDEKLRVCRYRIIDQAQGEDKTMLILTLDKTARVNFEAMKPAAAKPRRRAAPTKSAPEIQYPEFYEEYNKKQMESLAVAELRWLAKEWEVKLPPRQPGVPQGKPDLVKLLLKEARNRKRSWLAK